MITLLPCQGAFCYVTLVPQGVALGWWLIAPFRGAFVRTIIADGHCKYPCLIHPDCNLAKRFLSSDMKSEE